MASEEKQAERTFIREVIRLYGSLPALWNIKSKEYTNRKTKEYQYEILLGKYQERYPNSGKIELLKKINSLRTNFRKELKRLNEAKNSGKGEVPATLWYYDEMTFLVNQENETEATSSGDNCQERKIVEQNPAIIKTSPQKAQTPKNKPKELPQNVESTIPARASPKIYINSSKTSREIEPRRLTFVRNNKTLSPRRIAPVHQEYEKIGAFWAIELQKMDEKQQLFAKKAINDILFEGQLGNLHRNSIEINRIAPPAREQSSPTIADQSSLTSQLSAYDEEDNEEEEPNISLMENVKFEIQHLDPIDVIQENKLLNMETTNELDDDNMYDEQTWENSNSSSLHNGDEEEVNEECQEENDQMFEDEQFCYEEEIHEVEERLLEEHDGQYEEEISDKEETQGQSRNNQIRNFEKLEEVAVEGKSKEASTPKDRRVMCSYCSKIIHNITFLKQHEQLHKEHRERKVICPYCGIKLYTKSSLYSHLKTHKENREEKKLKCEFCDKSYYNRGALNIHRRIHLGKMFQCPICPKQCFRKIDLDSHLSSHSTEPLKKKKYFIRCKDCNRKVSTNRWNEHKAVHMNTPLFKCTICNKNFFNRSSVNKHVRLLHHISREDYANFIFSYEEKSGRSSLVYLRQQETVETMELE